MFGAYSWSLKLKKCTNVTLGEAAWAVILGSEPDGANDGER